jgi:hypothetical protein
MILRPTIRHTLKSSSLWSISLGRPNAIRLQDIACPMISPLHPSSDMALLSSWADLCKIQVEMVDLYTTSLSRPLEANRVIDNIKNLSQKLSEWQESLHDSLKYSRDNFQQPPSTYTLHMAYLASCIVLHRPLTSFRDLGRALDTSRDSRYDASVPTTKCRSAALDLAKLLKEFTTHFPHKQMPTLLIRMSFIASTTLVFGILSADESQQEQLQQDRASLTMCLETLGLLEQMFPSAKYTRAVLHKILRGNKITLEDNPQEESPISLTDFYNGNQPSDWAMDSILGLPSDTNWMQQSMASIGPGMHSFPLLNIDGQAVMPQFPDIALQEQQNIDPVAERSTFPMQFRMPFDGSGFT